MKNKNLAIVRHEDRDGRLDLVLEDSNHRKYEIRLWEGDGVTQLPDPEWIVRNFVQKGGLTVVYGPPASGKSLLMLDWAQRIELGQDYLKHHVRKGKVLYVMAEGQFGLKGRLEAWMITHGSGDSLPPVKYHIEGVSFWAAEGKENPGADAIVAAAIGLEVDVVFVDTMAATFGGGDENRQQDMNLFLKPLRELRHMGVAVVIAHHSNLGSGSLRGSSVLGGDADTIIEMKPTWDDDNPGQVNWVTVVCQKQKDYVPFPPFRLNLLSVELEEYVPGRPRSGPVLVRPALEEVRPPAKGATASGESAQEMLDFVRNNPGSNWTKVRNACSGSNEKKAQLRDLLIATGNLEYREAENGFYIREAEQPPMIGEENATE